MHPPTRAPAAPAARAPGAPFGFLLLAPAALVALVTLLIPTAFTVLSSLQRGSLLGSRGFAGPDNYLALLGRDQFWSGLALSLSLVLIPALTLLVLVPVLGVLLDRASTWVRLAGRVALSLPLAAFSPVALAAAWDRPVSSLTLPLVVGASVFGAVCGVGLTVALAALRGRDRAHAGTGDHTARAHGPGGPAPGPYPPGHAPGTGPRWATLAAVAGIAALALVAACLQTFSLPWALGGARGRDLTLGELQFNLGYRFFATGPGSALATTTGLLLGALGVLATFIAIRARLAMELLPRPPKGAARTPQGTSGARTVVAVLALVAVGAVTLVTQLPWLGDLMSPEPASPGPRLVGPSALRTQLNTWLPPLLGAIVGVGAAFLGAVGIGGLRPLGRHSEWLLMPFAPWLFVGTTPLGPALFDAERELGLFGTFAGLIPPVLLSVPALALLTLFCRGQSARWLAQPARTAGSFLRTVVVPALPLAGLLVGVGTVLGAQGLGWQLLMARPPDNLTAPIALAGGSPLYGEFGDTTPLAVLVPVFAALVAAQIWYLDRLAIRADDRQG